MKRQSLVLLLYLAATGFCIAQKTMVADDTTKDTIIIGSPYNETDIPTERHPTADLVQRIININADKLPVLIQYKEDKETANYVKELQESLVQYELKVSTQSSAQPMSMANNPKHNNCSYQVTDTLFIITAYPKFK